MLILISYDLKQPDRDYAALYEAIKSSSVRLGKERLFNWNNPLSIDLFVFEFTAVTL